jgi:hypothetical protein
MTAPTRLLLGGVAVTVVEAAAGAAALLVLGPVRVSLFLLVCAAATGVVSALVWRLTSNAGRGRGEGGSDGGTPTRGPDDPPPWWPGFERDFWEHVRNERHRPPAQL